MPSAAAAALVAGFLRPRRLRLLQTGAAALLASALLLLLFGRRTPLTVQRGGLPLRSPRHLSLPAMVDGDVPEDENATSTAEAAEAAQYRRRLVNRGYLSKVLRHFPNGGAESPQYRLLEGRCRWGNATSAAPADPQLPQHPVGYVDLPYLINFGPCPGRVAIVLAVHSAVGHTERRRVIRETWGSVRYVRGRRLLLAFFLGRPVDPGLQPAVEAEAARHGDIVQRDFLDTYKNMTLKHLGLYDWLAEFCQTPDWLVKLDDDVFVDVFHLEAFLAAYRPAGLCCKLQEGRPERQPGDKWFVTREEFPGDKYPKYCEGYAYIAQPTIVQLLYWCSVFSPQLWIDDVYVLGILVRRLGLKPQQPVGGHLWADLLPSHTGRAIANNIFLVDRHNGLQSGTWRRLHRAAMMYSF